MTTSHPRVPWVVAATAAASTLVLLAATLLNSSLTSGATLVAAAEGDTFSAPGVSVAGTPVDTLFGITASASTGAPGEVRIGDGDVPAIDTAASGDLAIPATVTHSGLTYKVTAIADNAFRGAVGLTSTGLAANDSVESIGDFAFANAFTLADTGLAANTTVRSIGVGAFGSARALRHGALPAGLDDAPSIPFTSATNLQSVYASSALPTAVKLGVKKSLPLYYRSGAEGWDTTAGTFAELSLYGPKPSELVPLSAVTVSGGEASVGDGANPYHAATGLFAGPGVASGSGAGRAADTVTVTASDTAAFAGWEVTGIELTAEQLASPTVTFAMPSSDVVFEQAGSSGVTITATTTSRCVAGKAYLVLTLRNDDTQPVTFDVTTPYGGKSIADLAPGRSTSATWNSRLVAMPAGEATVSATSDDGRTATTTVSFGAFTCGVTE
ncbi:MAG TPA: leucine-rich repeat protein [Arachnia sp.]|nr:leucine-rich repeat protein [Arachnia sp.]HMT85817.1 leucine-rich repeat protein [Arachnia sp.]